MHQILTCVENVSDGLGICPVGQGLVIVEGYIFSTDPTVFDPSMGAAYFAAGFGPVLCVYLIARGAGAVISLFRGKINEL